jgi:hypothetical protein
VVDTVVVEVQTLTLRDILAVLVVAQVEFLEQLVVLHLLQVKGMLVEVFLVVAQVALAAAVLVLLEVTTVLILAVLEVTD